MNSSVKLEWINTGTALVSMQDSVTNNALSENIFSGLSTAFTQINQNQQAKAVILTGLSSHFCCSQVSANSMQENNIQQNVLLTCELPVIAAMNGDALGDGLILAAFADILIMAEEANYSTEDLSNHLVASYIIPKKFGALLGNELLYTSQKYPGHVLKTRNAPIRITQKEKVIDTALELAKDLNEKLEKSLRLLKNNFTHRMEKEMSDYFQDNKAYEKN